MAISRERAVFLSHELIERIVKTPGLALAHEREFVRNALVKGLVDWDREHDRLMADAKKKLLSRSRKVTEGSREWDLLFAEELERSLTTLLGQGE